VVSLPTRLRAVVSVPGIVNNLKDSLQNVARKNDKMQIRLHSLSVICSNATKRDTNAEQISIVAHATGVPE